MFIKYNLILLLILFIVHIKMETLDDEYDDYEYDNYSNQNNIKQINELDRNKDREHNYVKEDNNYVKEDDNYVKEDDNYRKEDDNYQKEDDNNQKEDDKYQKEDDKYRKEDDNNYRKDEDNDQIDRIPDKYEIAKYENLKYENNKNYEIIPTNYELIDDYDEQNHKYLKQQPKLNKKNQIKLIKDVKYPKSLVSTSKHYYPGRNFVHQRSSIKKSNSLNKLNQKIKIKSDKFINDDLSTLIPLELYKHQIKSKFITNNQFTNDNKLSSRLEQFDIHPQILNGELYCDCGFYLKLKNKKIDKLNSKLKKVSNEQKQMKRKLIEMAVKENQLQLICRSQSKANLKYFNKQNGKPAYLALSNATSQSNPINLL